MNRAKCSIPFESWCFLLKCRTHLGSFFVRNEVLIARRNAGERQGLSGQVTQVPDGGRGAAGGGGGARRRSLPLHADDADLVATADAAAATAGRRRRRVVAGRRRPAGERHGLSDARLAGPARRHFQSDVGGQAQVCGPFLENGKRLYDLTWFFYGITWV